MQSPAIVVIAYNRPMALKRLLESINNADFSGDNDVSLIISIDKSDSDDVALVAREFEFLHGNKRIIEHTKNLGLKKHVLSCGNLVNEYESIVMLEDDLYVSPGFFTYAKAALSFVGDDCRICGVSLYNHRLNVHVRDPFEAIDDGYDNYYLKLCSSWGQAFTRSEWNAFTAWLSENDGKNIAANNVPENISSWSDKSWLKYFVKYMTENDRYFLYPRVSLTTNFGDEGEHAESSNTDLQVPLSGCVKRDYSFSTFDSSDAVYDAFFENVRLKRYLENVCRQYIANDNDGGSDNGGSKECVDLIETDLYGYRKTYSSRFVLTGKSLPNKVIKSYARALRPIDANIIYDVLGRDFFLYDLYAAGEAPKTKDAERILYNYRAISAAKMLKVLKYRFFRK